MIGCCKKKRENYPGKCFEQKKKKLGLKFNPGLALIGLRTTGPWGPFLESSGNFTGPKSNIQIEI